MNKQTSRKASFAIVVTVALLVVWFGADTLLAQGPGRNPRGGSPIDTFTYQGQLTDNNVPANGLYDFRIRIYDADPGGNQIGSAYLYDDWLVTNGIFSMNVSGGFQGSVFNGDGRWLQVDVRPGSSVGAYTSLPRQPITAVPYAFSLRPGAVISSTAYASDGWILKVDSDGTTYPTASAILATNSTGYAVHGDSTSYVGLYGTTQDGYGVMGIDLGGVQGRGYGGFFESMNGIGVYGESLADRTWNNVHAPGVYGKSTNGAGVMGMSRGINGQAGHFVNTYTTTAGSQVGVWAATYWGNIYEGWEVPPWDTTGTYGGNLRFRVAWNGNVYADGTFTGGGADVAERIDARSTLEPGDVVEIDPNDASQFRLSQSAHSTLVAGVVSTNPGLTMNNNPSDQANDDRPLLALVGQVPVKVTAENGAIKPGDLLVASSTPGHAMKAGANPPPGTIIGKALEKLDAGTSVIKMLVMLR